LSIGTATTLTVLQPASATESVKSAHKQDNGEKATPKSSSGENGIKTIKSAAGFEFKYPSGWIVAFERGNSSKEGTIAFVGNFINIDTFSVEKKLLDPAVAAKTDLVEMAEAVVNPIKSLPTTIAFEDFGGTIKDSLNGPQSLCVLEYSVELCKGVVTEQLKGKKLCRDVKDNELQTIKRHHLYGVTKTANALYYLNASCPADRWEVAKNDLMIPLNSFVALM